MAVSAGLAPTKEEQEVKKLAAALARHTGQDEDTAGRHSWGRLAMLLQREMLLFLAIGCLHSLTQMSMVWSELAYNCYFLNV